MDTISFVVCGLFLLPLLYIFSPSFFALSGRAVAYKKMLLLPVCAIIVIIISELWSDESVLLKCAVRHGFSNLAKFSLSMKRFTIGVDGASKMLLEAAHHGHLDIAKMLVEAGANINAFDRVRETALIKAAQQGHTDVVKFLLDGGANIDIVATSGWTAPGLAVIHMHEDVIQTFFDRDVDFRRTAVQAIYWGRWDIVSYLLEKWIRLNERDASEFRQVLLLYAATAGQDDIVKSLISGGAHVDAVVDESRETALMKAAQSGVESTILLLLNEGADVHRTARSGLDAFKFAVLSKSKGAIQIFLNKGFEVNEALKFATASNMSLDAVDLLCKMGADISSVDNSEYWMSRVQEWRKLQAEIRWSKGNERFVRMLEEAHAEWE